MELSADWVEAAIARPLNRYERNAVEATKRLLVEARQRLGERQKEVQEELAVANRQLETLEINSFAEQWLEDTTHT